jgi:hypothetical protein
MLVYPQDDSTTRQALCPCMAVCKDRRASGTHDEGTLVARKRQALGLRSISNLRRSIPTIRKALTLGTLETLSALKRHSLAARN